MRTWMIVACFAALALAGCVGGDETTTDGTTTPEPDCEFGYVDEKGVNVVDTDHGLPYTYTNDTSSWTPLDPWNAEYTNYRTCTLEEVGHEYLRFNGETPAPHKYLGEIDMRGDLNIGAVAVLGNGEDPMVYLVDITNRTDPEVMSIVNMQAVYAVDVKISDDGDFLFVASQYTGSATPNQNSPLPTGPAAPHGFTIFDISDRSNPTFQQFVPNVDGLGCHMLSHEIIDGTDVVFCVGQQVSAHGLMRTAAGLPWAYLGAFQYLLPDGSGAALPGACINDVVVADPAGLLCNGPHDMTVALDPVDDKTYMTVSHWNEGLRVVDVSNPLTDQFITVGGWNGEGAKHYSGNVHTAMMFWLGDIRYVVATPEMTSGGTVPSLWVLNATDIGNMELVAEWYNPQEIPTPGLFTTLHQWQVAPTGPEANVEDTNIYITMNHAGLWVLDFEKILEGDLPGAIGGFHMARDELDQSTAVGNAILSTWDVNVVDGFIYGSDRATGLWVFDYTEDNYADPALTGFA